MLLEGLCQSLLGRFELFDLTVQGVQAKDLVLECLAYFHHFLEHLVLDINAFERVLG